MTDRDIDEMLSIDPTIASVLDNCVKVCRKRGEWVSAEIYQKALDEIRKRDKKIKHLQGKLFIERVKSGNLEEEE